MFKLPLQLSYRKYLQSAHIYNSVRRGWLQWESTVYDPKSSEAKEKILLTPLIMEPRQRYAHFWTNLQLKSKSFLKERGCFSWFLQIATNTSMKSLQIKNVSIKHNETLILNFSLFPLFSQKMEFYSFAQK